MDFGKVLTYLVALVGLLLIGFYMAMQFVEGEDDATEVESFKFQRKHTWTFALKL